MNSFFYYFIKFLTIKLSRPRKKQLESLLIAGCNSEQLTISEVARTKCLTNNNKFNSNSRAIGRVCEWIRKYIYEFASAWFNLLTANRNRVYLSLDWTKLADQWLLQAALVMDGRAIPVWFNCIPIDERKDMETVWEWIVMCRVMSFASPNLEVVFIADRGFGKMEFFQKNPWPNLKLVIRLKGNLKLRWGSIDCKLNELPLLKGDQLCLSDVELTNHRLKLAIGILWDYEHEHPIIVCGHPELVEDLLSCYKLRAWIENLFRDLKFRSHLHWSYFPYPENRQAWLLIVSMIFFLRLMMVRIHEAEAQRFQRKRENEKRDLCFLKAGLYLWKMKLPFDFRMGLL